MSRVSYDTVSGFYQLAGLIMLNHFDRKYGITVADVVADIKAYKANPDTIKKLVSE